MAQSLFVCCVRALPRRASVGVALLGAAVLAAGCVSSKTAHYSTVGARVADAPTSPVPVKIEVEDDGVPVQTAPLRRARPDTDDPSEPYSRDYGSRLITAPARNASLRRETAPRATVGYDSTFDADGVMAQAIAAHEARVQ